MSKRKRNKYPYGKLDHTDEGEMTIAISSPEDGVARIDFGKPVLWFAVHSR